MLHQKINSEYVLSLHEIGFKPVPVSEDGVKPTIEWSGIYQDGWDREKIQETEFPNVATCFGKSSVKDEDGQILYLNCLDIDSDEVFSRLAMICDDKDKQRFVIDELCGVTYVTRTRKKIGRHIYWLSHNSNLPIHVNDCRVNHEFEIKTDKSSGLAGLEPSSHRNDKSFYYRNIGQDKIIISDSLYGIFLRLLDDCLKDKDASFFSNRAESLQLSDAKISEICELLSPIYRLGYRHQLCYSLSGILHRKGIGLNSTSKIINIIARDDEELQSGLGIMRHTYSKESREVSGLTEFLETLTNASGDKNHAKEIWRNIIRIIDNNVQGNIRDEDHALIAEQLSNEFQIKVMQDTREMYYYDTTDHKYNPHAENIIRKQLELMYPMINSHHVNEIIEKIRRRNMISRSEFNSNPHIINIKNGLLNILTGELFPHSPDFLSTIQLPIKYDNNARCPAIIRFLGQVLRPHDIFTFIQFCGYCLFPSAKYEKALILIGEGDNGKGTLLKLLEAFLGLINISHASLKELSDDKFAASNLNHKLANICADIEHGQIHETSFFKRLVSGDSIRAQEKHQPAFDFANYAKLIFSSNYFPNSKDDSYAWLKRIIPIFCPNTFDENKDVFLLEKLTTEEELAGLLNLALIGLSQLIKDGTFNHVENIQALSNYYQVKRIV
jgi:P4 family phage/plasmid primase-like protien